MIRNYLKTALRNLIRNKKYSLINISGLAIGIASCILIFIVVHYELSYDRFQPDYNRIYQVAIEDKSPDAIDYTPGTPYPVLEAMRAKFPQIVTGVLYSGYNSQLSAFNADGSLSGEKKFIEDKGVFFSDPQFFKIFQYEWLSGTPDILDQPNVTVLSKKTAEKYFGRWQDAVGKFLRLDNLNTVQVKGVIGDAPGNSDFRIRMVSSYLTFKNTPFYGYSKEWGTTSSNEQLYMLLPRHLSAASVNRQLAQYSIEMQNRHSVNKRTIFIRPLSILHFDQRMGNMGDHVTSKSTLLTLSLIALFILIMACINFVNLSTVQAVNRSKEIGVRKVLGSNRRNLLWQMLGETAFLVLVSIVLAVVLAEICLPFIKNIASIDEPISLLNLQTIFFLAAIFITVTLMSGMYPALIVSGFSPMLALKNKINSSTVGGISLRRSLVVLQFCISQVLIAGTLIAITQMSFVAHADLGLNKDAVLVINGNGDSTQTSRIDAFKTELLKIPAVRSVSLSTDVPSSENNWGSNFAFNHKPDENFILYLKYADPDYFKTFGLQFAAGGPPRLSDTLGDVVVNETFIHKTGLKNPEDAIGKDVRIGGSAWKRISGVVRDFRTNSLREGIRPILIGCTKKNYSTISLKLRTGNLALAREQVQHVWDRFYPEYANQTFFMDEQLENFYQQEHQLTLLYKIFAGIAIFLSCLGLYGLVSFMAVQKRKEVGIRKVLGAGITQIIYLFSKEFTILILVALVIAVPVSWYMMNSWLSHFAYRITVSPLIFIAAALISIVIAWATVGYKSFRAALANPVNSLRSE